LAAPTIGYRRLMLIASHVDWPSRTIDGQTGPAASLIPFYPTYTYLLTYLLTYVLTYLLPSLFPFLPPVSFALPVEPSKTAACV